MYPVDLTRDSISSDYPSDLDDHTLNRRVANLYTYHLFFACVDPAENLCDEAFFFFFSFSLLPSTRPSFFLPLLPGTGDSLAHLKVVLSPGRHDCRPLGYDFFIPLYRRRTGAPFDNGCDKHNPPLSSVGAPPGHRRSLSTTILPLCFLVLCLRRPLFFSTTEVYFG